MDIFRQFETVRHGEKKGEELSAAGIEQAKEKAKELFNEIKNSSSGFIFYTMSSNVGRAVATRNIIEEELRWLAQGDKEIEIISVHDVEKIEQAQEDKSKKYIITEVQPSTALGFNDKTQSIPAFVKFKKLFRNNEDLIGVTWAARSDEIETLKERFKQEIPDLDVSEIKPNEFRETPEEAALKYIQLMRRMAEITKKYFPDHPWKGLQIGHNLSADFAVIAMLGKEISIKSIEELGGNFRQFLESAFFVLEKGKIIVTYRGQTIEQAKTLDEIIEDLKKASEKRKKEWETA